MFGRKSRAEKLREQAEDTRFVPIGTLIAAYAGAKPVAERLLYDDELRDNIRTFIDSAQRIINEISNETPSEAVARLWDDDKLRKQVEDAVQAADEGSRRFRGEKVKGGGGGFSGLLFLLLAAGGALIFLNPKTGPQARRFAKETYSSLTS